MKTKIKTVAGLLGLAACMNASSAVAARPSAYVVDPMICVGKIVGNPKGVHSSFFQVLIRMTSAYSMRRDGSKALSLEVTNSYYGPREKIDLNNFSIDEIGYTSSLYSDDLTVSKTDFFRNRESLELKIVSSKAAKNGARIDKLVGVWSRSSTAAGSVSYQLQCEARRTGSPSKIIDLRKRQ